LRRELPNWLSVGLSGEDLLAVGAAFGGSGDLGLLATVAVAQLVQDGERHDGQYAEDEIEGKPGGDECASGDGGSRFPELHRGPGLRPRTTGKGRLRGRR
jgi:hypothetical protein